MKREAGGQGEFLLCPQGKAASPRSVGVIVLIEVPLNLEPHATPSATTLSLSHRTPQAPKLSLSHQQLSFIVLQPGMAVVLYLLKNPNGNQKPAL
jgi:hypothetical protein